MAFLAAGHTPGRGQYGKNVDRALDYVLKNAKPSGLLNIADPQRDMYNHGLSTFVLGQAHRHDHRSAHRPGARSGLEADRQHAVRRRRLGLRAKRQPHGHDLSLAVMQAKALRSAVDSGLEVPPEVIELAIKSVREHYQPASGKRQRERGRAAEAAGPVHLRRRRQATMAMAAAASSACRSSASTTTGGSPRTWT